MMSITRHSLRVPGHCWEKPPNYFKKKKRSPHAVDKRGQLCHLPSAVSSQGRGHERSGDAGQTLQTVPGPLPAGQGQMESHAAGLQQQRQRGGMEGRGEGGGGCKCSVHQLENIPYSTPGCRAHSQWFPPHPARPRSVVLCPPHQQKHRRSFWCRAQGFCRAMSTPGSWQGHRLTSSRAQEATTAGAALPLLQEAPDRGHCCWGRDARPEQHLCFCLQNSLSSTECVKQESKAWPVIPTPLC